MEMSRESGPPARSLPEPSKAEGRRRGRWAVGLAALAAAMVAGVAALSYRSPWIELSRLERALAERDEAALARGVDWASVRQKLVVKIATEALRAGQLQPGDERVSQVILGVEAAVDGMASPEAVARLMEKAKGGSSALRVVGGYLNMGVFVFAIEDKGSHGALTLRMRRMGPFSWKVDELIFLTPQQLGAAAGQGAR